MHLHYISLAPGNDHQGSQPPVFLSRSLLLIYVASSGHGWVLNSSFSFLTDLLFGLSGALSASVLARKKRRRRLRYVSLLLLPFYAAYCWLDAHYPSRRLFRLYRATFLEKFHLQPHCSCEACHIQLLEEDSALCPSEAIGYEDPQDD